VRETEGRGNMRCVGDREQGSVGAREIGSEGDEVIGRTGDGEIYSGASGVGCV